MLCGYSELPTAVANHGSASQRALPEEPQAQTLAHGMVQQAKTGCKFLGVLGAIEFLDGALVNVDAKIE